MPGPPLFETERLLGSWSACYLPPEALYDATADPPPVGLLVQCRNLFLKDSIIALDGRLHLTSRRVIFEATPGLIHPFSGHFSMFLPKLATMNGQSSKRQEFLHVGSKDPSLWAQSFHLPRPARFSAELLQIQSERIWRINQGADRAFEQHLLAGWWRAGLGLQVRAAVDEFPDPSGYRNAPPSFDELTERRKGLAGVGLSQLRWLLMPDEPEPAPPEPLPEGLKAIHIDEMVGRPLVIDGGLRRGRLRRGGRRGWG